jgi:hypothetical protein
MINSTSLNEAHYAERRICTLKERCWCICNILPFKKVPGMLVVQMVSTCNLWLNIFPPKDGISRNINPRELITGVKIDYYKHIQAEFGEYLQVHKEHDNTMNTRTTGAIAMKPTGDAQGRHWFYSLATGRMLDHRLWTPLPMPSDVIKRINILAKAIQRYRPTTTLFDNTSWNRLVGPTAIPHAPASGIVSACLGIQVRIVH